MKRILLFLFILLSLSQARASDTLTVRQVFNFNVGDTFDYRSTVTVNGGDFVTNFETYSRFIISATILSADSDTITYIRHQVYPLDRFDTLVYTNLTASIFGTFGAPSGSASFTFGHHTLSDGRLIDSLLVQDSQQGVNYKSLYGAGLGLFYTSYEAGNVITDTTLIYYAKGTDTAGTTYYRYIGPRVPHFTPIPEECAYWTYQFQCGPYSGNYSNGALAQVRTGNKVYFNNHSYVQLLVIGSLVIGDGVLGYFRNDTVGQKVYFTNDSTVPEVLLCDFTLRTSDSALENNFLHLDTISIGGSTRIVWEDATYPWEDTVLDYIEGIGSVFGFPGMGSENVQYYSYIDEGEDICTEAPVLISFCVCGQTLYSPYGEVSDACFPLAINEITTTQQVSLYPNPTNDLLHLSISDASQSNTQFIITDLLGQEVYSSPVTQSETTHDISKLASGIYTWRVVENNTIIKTGKVVKE